MARSTNQPFCQRRIQEGNWGDRSPPKPTEGSLFTIILYNSENNIRVRRPFCRPLFCHSNVVKYTFHLSCRDSTIAVTRRVVDSTLSLGGSGRRSIMAETITLLAGSAPELFQAVAANIF